MTLANSETGGNRARHKVFRLRDSFLDRFAFSQLGRDGGREGTAGSVRTHRVYFLTGVGPKSAAVEQQITGVFFEVPAPLPPHRPAPRL